MSKVVRPFARIAGSIAGIVGAIIGGPIGWLTAGLGIGLSFLGRAKKKQQEFQVPTITPAPPPLSQTVRASTAPRVRAYGRVRQAGVEFMKENTSDKKYLLQGFYLNEGPIDGFDAMIIDDEFVPIKTVEEMFPSDPATFPANIFAPSAGSKYNYAGGPLTSFKDTVLVALEIVNAQKSGFYSWLLGNWTPSLIASFSTIWNSSHLGKNVSIIYTWSNANPTNGERIKFYPNGFPVFSFIYRAARVYDPRDPSQVFSTYDPYDSTWKFSENPALIAADYVNWLISEGLTAIQGVNWLSVAEAADDCDRLVQMRRAGFNGGAIGQERFAIISALITLDMEPREVLSQIMATCDADYGVDHNGLFTMAVGKWREPQITFTGADLGDYTEDFLPSSNDEVNYMHVSYVEPRQNHQKVEAPIYRDLYSESLIGRRSGSIEFEWVTSASQAYRLAARRVKRANGKRIISATLGARAMTALKQRVVGIDVPERGIVGTFSVEQLAPSGDLATWQAQLVEVTEDVFSDEVPPNDTIVNFPIVNQPALVAPTALIAGTVSTRGGFGVAQLSLDVNKNFPDQAMPSVTAAALLTDPTLQLDGRWSTNGGSTWTNFDTLISHLIMQTPELQSGLTVTMQARWVSSAGTNGAYSPSVQITIP